MRTDIGSPQLKNSQSIMAYDRPAYLGNSGSDEKHGGLIIDSESLLLLRTLYPAIANVHHGSLVNSQTSGWRAGVGTITARKRFSTSEIYNIITGLTRLDMGLNGNFRHTSYHGSVTSDGFEVVQGCWADTHIIDASCDVLSFSANDTRIQTGRESYNNWKSGDVPGRPLSRRITFSRPWKNVPAVVAFISGIDFSNRPNLRCEVTATSIDRTGFTLNLNTWAGKFIFSMNWVTVSLLKSCRQHCLRHFGLLVGA